MEKNYEQISSNASHRSAGSHGSVGSYSDDEVDGDIVDLQAADTSLHGEAVGAEHSPFSGEAAEKLSSSPDSQPSAYSPVSNVRASSFTFDDDDDEDEENLKRYNLDFSIDADRAKLAPDLAHGRASSQSSSQQNSILQFLWFSFQSQRQQARQRRAQLLLQQSERDFRQSVWICVSTYCDATDRGIILVAALIIVWVVLLLAVFDEGSRKHWIVSGLLVLMVRLGARPLWGYISRQRQRRRLQSQDRQSHSPLPTQSPAPKQLRQRVNSNEEYDDSPQGRYLDEPPQNGNLELQNIA